MVARLRCAGAHNNNGLLLCSFNVPIKRSKPCSDTVGCHAATRVTPAEVELRLICASFCRTLTRDKKSMFTLRCRRCLPRRAATCGVRT